MGVDYHHGSRCDATVKGEKDARAQESKQKKQNRQKTRTQMEIARKQTLEG